MDSKLGLRKTNNSTHTLLRNIKDGLDIQYFEVFWEH